ncbi:MAG: Hsp70 family protein [Anaerolineae bacterium]|nr:Hsp70 family protein [Anaerolineae bacterium]
MYIGLDFGTTNSGAATFDGQRVRIFPLDPAGRDPGVIRSVLYVTREQEVFVGQEAVDEYYRQNVGRPSRMARYYVGEIEMTAAEIGTFVKDVYVLVDELTPGRLLRSLKSGLATSYEGTDIFGRYYALEESIAVYLRALRERVEAETGEPVAGVVLGRPVTFVGGEADADNQRAEERLRRAAEMAGFCEVAFELEPVAAALHYELTVKEPQNVVVFDFGGGTLDITVMRVGGAPAERQIFSTGGVGIAGDAFDQRIIERLLLDHFGRGSTWGEDGAPFPAKYTDPLVHWQTIPELNRPESLRFLELAQISGSHPSRVRALESLLVNNYAMHMVDEVERAKIALSAAHFAAIQVAGEDINLWQPVTRAQFEALIADAVRRIESCLLDMVERSGLSVGEIDAVVRTGGSAQIPCFIEMVGRIFGPEKVVLSSVFSGVTSGLAIRARDSVGRR